MSFICKKCSHNECYNEKSGRKRCKECQRVLMRKTYQTDAYRTKNRLRHRLKRRYCTNEQYEKMLIDQDGKCKICDLKFDKNLRVDHCHNSKKVRGLLCDKCNCGLGFFKDSKVLLMKAIEYLN